MRPLDLRSECAEAVATALGAENADSIKRQANGSADTELPQFRNRRAFPIWSLMIGAVMKDSGPRTVSLRVVAEVERETTS